MEEFKKWFNQEGTITGWQAIGRNAIAFFIYIIGMVFIEASPELGILVLLPALVFYVWLLVATAVKRMKSFGFEGQWYNLMFPSLTDGTYPNRKKDKK